MNAIASKEADLVERYLPLAHSVSWAIVRRYPWTDYDDAYSDALLGLFNAVRARRGHRISAFIRSRIEGECMHGVRRRRGVRGGSSLEPPPVVSLDHPASETLGTSSALKTDIAECDWIERLPSDQRKAVLLTAIGFSQTEIAPLLGVSQMTVSRWLTKARKDWLAVA